LLPYRNWDIYLGAGLTYYEQSLVDYYIGINADEVTINRPLHSADSGFRAQLEVYAQYPLSQSWSFNAGLTQSFYPNKIKRSPLVDKNKLTQLMVGVLYVF
jgi:outer membrane scaffolding protein for murein synthesis (MipA/OmpV family)